MSPFRLSLFALSFSLLLAGCTTTPQATELPESEFESLEEMPPPPLPASRPATAPTEEASEPEPPPLPIEEIEFRGVRGGRIAFTVPGTPDQVLAMLLDLENAAGHRSWAETYTVESRGPERVVSRWTFEGRAGINPVVTVELRTQPHRDGWLVRYRLIQTDFGLAAFFGDYRIAPLADRPGESLLVERVYIDSGTWLDNASAEDIADGLREDAKLIQEWMSERLARPAP